MSQRERIHGREKAPGGYSELWWGGGVLRAHPPALANDRLAVDRTLLPSHQEHCWVLLALEACSSQGAGKAEYKQREPGFKCI
ncbi:hypothetical protein AAFF_G00038670 [Aldrovandia affinis]|uniref:Uncharacterized protein n=1 Tax=Aldrovandia affinis TaxID=143900 RepID=A0AAD7T5B4_9TELE|nr:hypothetical protein AAFF_G00038670 [Aldrovandia affinis]